MLRDMIAKFGVVDAGLGLDESVALVHQEDVAHLLHTQNE